ncbi:MAG: thiamine diphosphokinase [Alistipes sp.]|nr:thiamine diphosphokinase [Alistipes sp.]
MKECAVFAGGVIEDPGYIDKKELLDNCGFIICADGGYRYAQALEIIPDLFVGDFDSYSGELPEGISVHRSVPEKDDTDTLLAVREAIDAGFDKIRLYGALGARIDHTLANIQTMLFAHDRNCKLEIIDETNEMYLQGVGTMSYKRRDGWYFSLFAVGGIAHISSCRGVKYPIDDYEMTPCFPIGVSNEITAENAVLSVDSGIVLVVRSKRL